MIFDTVSTAQDLQTLRGILTQFYGGVRDDDWGRKTGSREKDWTLAETTAHVTSVAQTFNKALEAGIAGASTEIPGLARREDLPDWNASQVASLLAQHTPAEMVTQLDLEFERAAQLATALTPEQAKIEIPFAFYNRPAALGNLMLWQLSHLGVIHGAQLPRPLDQAPLWERYDGAMRQRQLGRFLLHFSWAYWNTLAPDLTATLHMQISGAYGGDWTLVAAPDGGTVLAGIPENPTYVYYFANPDVFFSLFTVNETFQNAQAHGEFKVTTGDPTDAIRLLRCFAASPPA